MHIIFEVLSDHCLFNYLLGVAMYQGIKILPTFWRNLLLPLSKSTLKKEAAASSRAFVEFLFLNTVLYMESDSEQ
jgi:hypothetical protein